MILDIDISSDGVAFLGVKVLEWSLCLLDVIGPGDFWVHGRGGWDGGLQMCRVVEEVGYENENPNGTMRSLSTFISLGRDRVWYSWRRNNRRRCHVVDPSSYLNAVG